MIVFQNRGEIDPRSITTFGVSSKETETAIGFFGTGLKYAIAILLREGCHITIYSGEKKLEFSARRDKIRVDEFEVVTMNRRRLGFTTELGKTWEMWQAFRELYCNCLDESGHAWETDEDVTGEAGLTTIVVKGAPFKQVWDQRSDVILEGEPLLSHADVDVHSGRCEFVYYRGVRAYKLGSPSAFTYNLKRKADLSEDRSIKYQWDIDVAVKRVWVECDDARLVKRIVTQREGYESGLNFESMTPKETFTDVVTRLAREYSDTLNRSALEACRIHMLDNLNDVQESTLTKLDNARLERAVKFCKDIGFPVDEYPILTSEFLGEGVLGRAHNEKIYLSHRVFMMGTKMVAGTLIEEFLHLKHHIHDETRSMQNFLMDTIVSLGEQVTGEPL